LGEFTIWLNLAHPHAHNRYSITNWMLFSHAGKLDRVSGQYLKECVKLCDIKGSRGWTCYRVDHTQPRLGWGTPRVGRKVFSLAIKETVIGLFLNGLSLIIYSNFVKLWNQCWSNVRHIHYRFVVRIFTPEARCLHILWKKHSPFSFVTLSFHFIVYCFPCCIYLFLSVLWHSVLCVACLAPKIWTFKIHLGLFYY
jgi:hypothetical protein